MDGESLLRECIETLGERNGIDGLTLEPNGCCGIELRDGRRLYLKLDREHGRVFVYRVVLALDTVDQDLLRRSMESNALEAETAGGVLSLSRRMNGIVYHKSVGAQYVDVAWLEQAMESMVVHGDHLAQSLSART
ncbi:CesT family type III secretion system chaperone [Trinickia caryophylli]|uniref:Tir chaperone protein (CesT) family protein n=1 Tax=Trinickia caryophylli TaxID=28094 RepID=A0A1X7D1H4_TRICW|nr:CesT family type III secretion system chaperone [Trinickia caryophylli]WQE15122.1 CesT family type III secretion system chaperone [Trinickia caryophylli]GLU31140.1 hypothetical protein Busp01_09820 [Trinickia caryophylli]SMF06954.1 Tir chaperone protein (CesT) family protein [Trinickia caryophylli]